MLHAPLSAGALRVGALLLTISLMPAAARGACAAASGRGTTALVELYSAVACDACRQADQWLADLGDRYPVHVVVRLAFHVRESDYTSGAPDPFRRRERRLLPRQRLALAHSPRVLLQGSDFPDWRDARFGRALEQAVAAPSRARLALGILGSGGGTLRVRVEAAVVDATPARVYVAAFEPRAAGPTAFEWVGPIGLGRQEVELALLPKGAPTASGAAAFVQDARSGEVLQALLVGPCRP